MGTVALEMTAVGCTAVWGVLGAAEGAIIGDHAVRARGEMAYPTGGDQPGFTVSTTVAIAGLASLIWFLVN